MDIQKPLGIFQSFDYFPQIAKDFENPKNPKTANPMRPTTCPERSCVHPSSMAHAFFCFF